MARTQKNKATNAHLGILKAKLAKLRRELITPKGGGGGAGEGFDVAKTGDARIGFVGGFSFHTVWAIPTIIKVYNISPKWVSIFIKIYICSSSNNTL